MAEAQQDTEHIMQMTRKVIFQKEVYSKQKDHQAKLAGLKKKWECELAIITAVHDELTNSRWETPGEICLPYTACTDEGNKHKERWILAAAALWSGFVIITDKSNLCFKTFISFWNSILIKKIIHIKNKLVYCYLVEINTNSCSNKNLINVSVLIILYEEQEPSLYCDIYWIYSMVT